jgi:hypothetical protein
MITAIVQYRLLSIITSTGEPILNVQPGLANVLIWIAFTNGITRIVVFQGENKVLLS